MKMTMARTIHFIDQGLGVGLRGELMRAGVIAGGGRELKRVSNGSCRVAAGGDRAREVGPRADPTEASGGGEFHLPRPGRVALVAGSHEVLVADIHSHAQ